MSVVAGIICLDGRPRIVPNEVHKMLMAMAPNDACPIDTIALPEKGIIVGRLRHGCDAGQEAGLDNPDGPKVLMLGELYFDSGTGAVSDAAYLLNRYRALGAPAFAKGLNGPYTVLVVDPAEGSVTIATDHMNAIQVHTIVHDGTFYFASEIKGLMALPHLPCKLDVGMALMSLTSNMLQNLRNVVADVKTMDGGSVWQIADGRIRKDKLWSYALEDHPADKGLDFYADIAGQLIGQAVRRMTRDDRPIVMMTGGLDTRTIVSFLENANRVSGVTLTGISEKFRHPLGDVALARRVATELGLKHTILQWVPQEVLDAIQNSVYGSDGAAGLLLEENLFDEVKRSGLSDYVIAGDECCSAAAGAIKEVHILECLGIRPVSEVPSLWPYIRKDRLEQFHQETASICSTRVKGLSGRPPNNQLDELEHYQRICHFVNPRRRLHMRHGLLARRPLLDLDYLDFLRTVPWRHRLGRKVVREALRRHSPRMFALPYARTREQVDLGLVIAQKDQEGGQASTFLFEDNPFMEEIFDIAALRGLVKQLADSNPAAASKPRFSVDLLLPRQARWYLAAFARKHLGMRSRALVAPGAILLSVAKVAATLRHVSRRCAKPARSWVHR